ncbi:unnamed protein product, partial [Larinioides sclopetarius]
SELPIHSDVTFRNDTVFISERERSYFFCCSNTSWDGYLGRDSLHPNRRGNTLLANCFRRSFKSCISTGKKILTDKPALCWWCISFRFLRIPSITICLFKQWSFCFFSTGSCHASFWPQTRPTQTYRANFSPNSILCQASTWTPPHKLNWASLSTRLPCQVFNASRIWPV